MLAYLGALAADLALPFVTSLGVALGTYGIGAALEASRERRMRPVELGKPTVRNEPAP